MVAQAQIVPMRRTFARLQRLLADELKPRDIELVAHVEPETLEITVDADLLDQARINLMRNAMDALREGVYLVPETTATRQGLEYLADYISKGSGSAQVLAVVPVSEAQQQAFRKMFDRSARYTELLKVVDSLKR